VFAFATFPAMSSSRRACTAAAVGKTPNALSMMDIVVTCSKLSEIHFAGVPEARDVPTERRTMQDALLIDVEAVMPGDVSASYI
jgi:hypothetical protein